MRCVNAFIAVQQQRSDGEQEMCMSGSVNCIQRHILAIIDPSSKFPFALENHMQYCLSAKVRFDGVIQLLGPVIH